MRWLTDLRIRVKLILVTVLTSAIALLLAGVVIIAYDNYVYRAQKTGEISAQAGVLAASMTASLEFNDLKAAQEYLNPLEANPEITAAGVYASNGSLFASYSRSGTRPPPPSAEPQVQRFEGNEFVVFWPVRQGQRQVGTVYLRASTETLAVRITRFGGIILLVMLGSLLITLPIAMRLHTVIANPVYARSLIEASLDPLVTISPDGKITDVNEATVKVTGISREKLIGSDFSNYFTEPGKAREGYRQVFQKGFVTDYPLTIRHKDGRLTDVLYNASVYKDARGNVLGVFAAARDVTAQKQASQYVRSLIEASLDPLVTISPDGKITDVNEATVKVTGASRQKLIGTDFADYFTEPAKAREGYQQVFSKGFVTDYPLTIRHRGGKLTDVLYNASVYKDTAGKVLGVFAAARDITAQKQASQYARSLIEASLDPLVTISPDGKVTDVNEATVNVTGIPREQLIGTDFSNYFTEPDKAREGYQQVFAEGFVTDYPLTIRHKDGRLTDVLYNASVYKDVRGNVLGVFAAARDVTESKRIMREFAETKNFLDNILQSSTKYSIIGKDLDRKVLSWNEGARRNYGYAAEEIIGKDSNILHSPEDLKSGAVDRLLATAYEKRLAEGEFVRVRKDGSRFAASVVVTRRDDATGRPIGYLLMSNDISEKKRAEERLRAASQYARSLVEASLDPLVTISPEGKITDVNEATIKVTGAPRESLVGADFADYFTEPTKAREGYQQVFSKGFVTDYPLTIRHRDGKLTDVLYNASVYKDIGSNVLGVFAAARDITAQKRAEALVAEQRARDLERLAELERFQKLTVGRELKMIELKKEIEELKAKH